MTRAVIYARKSTVDQRNPGKSIADQVRECKVEAERIGLDTPLVIHDDGKSASRHARKGITRDGYAELIALVRAGKVDVVLMAEQSRGSRRLSELGTLLEASADSGVTWIVGGRAVDPRDPADITLAAVQGGMDMAESERLSKRARRGAHGAAIAGRPSAKLGYGYSRTYDPVTRALQSVDVVPEEADVLLDCKARILAGESLYGVANRLNAAGVPAPADAVAARQGRAPKGTLWSGGTVTRLLTSPTYAALRVHHLGKPDEEVTKGVWPALWSKAESQRLVRILHAPERRRSATGRSVDGAVVHWLSGLAVCGVCGEKLRVIMVRKRYRTYGCKTVGCFRVGRAAGPLEAFVRDVVIGLASRPAVRRAVAVSAQAESSNDRAWERVDELTARLDELRAAIVSGAMTIAFATPVVADLERDIAQARRKAGKIVMPSLPNVDLTTLAETFDSMEPGQKRAIAAAFVTVTVNPAAKGVRFNPEHVDVVPTA
jgi:site-specific DNA recombinase